MGNATAKAKYITCDRNHQATCLTTTIKTFGRKVFRRPLTNAEVTSFMRLNSLTQPGLRRRSPRRSWRRSSRRRPSSWPLSRRRTSPQGSSFQLNNYEVATKLSFLFLNSSPTPRSPPRRQHELGTADLLRRRRSGSSPTRRRQAWRLPSASVTAIPTGSHWVNNKTHDTTKYPASSPGPTTPRWRSSTRSSGRRAQRGRFKDMFLSPTGFVTKDTASIYGDTSSSSTPEDGAGRDQAPGILTRVGFLSTFSHYDSTSPIFRGAFITGGSSTSRPARPTRTPEGGHPDGNYNTQREAIEAMGVSPCLGCHALKVNPPGFVLEHYNAVGGWQDTDPLGGAIDRRRTSASTEPP